MEFAPTLSAALQALFQVNVSPGSTPSTPTGPSTPVSSNVQALIAQANQDFQKAQSDLEAGNFAAYGTDQMNLKTVIQQLVTASGTSSSSTTKPKSSATTTTTTQPSGVALGKPKH